MADHRGPGLLSAWLALLLLAATSPAPAQSPQAGSDRASPVLGLLYAPRDTSLASILDGTARVGFTPLITPGAPLHLHREQAAWVRLRADLPPRTDG